MTGNDRPWKSLPEQLELLKSRGLAVTDDDAALSYLERLGYYRLSAYWYPFRKGKAIQLESGELAYHRSNTFYDHASFKDAVNLYVFDKRLRMLALDALERVEVAIRVDIAHLIGERDTFAYQNPAELDGQFVRKINRRTGKTSHEEWLEKHEVLVNRSREDFVGHYRANHGLPLPIWVAIELWEFGLLSRFFSGMKFKDRETIAKKYGVRDGQVFASWLRSFNYLRNTCAHHCRLWNRNIVDQPRLPPRVFSPT